MIIVAQNSNKEATLKQLIYKNRGMDLESMLNNSNRHYLNTDKAVIYKKPTPIGVVKVAYKDNHKIIDRGYFKEQSTLDYNGLYKGKYIDFEAKVTKNRTAFPLSNIHNHQIEHMRKIIKHGGITFIIIMINEIVYLLPGQTFLDYIDTHNRKSIAYNFIKENGYEIKYTYSPELDYLKIVDKINF